MRQPNNRNSKIDAVRLQEWVSRFSAYRDPPTDGRIDRWLKQFKRHDRDIAARLLDSVEMIALPKILAAFQQCLTGLPGWHIDKNRRKGRWFFVGFATSPGESADQMMHLFRQANGLESDNFAGLFKWFSELPGLDLKDGDNIVFVDDFSGTGDQVCKRWQAYMKELLPTGPKYYLILAAVYWQARERIRKETDLKLVADIHLSKADNVFSDTCRHFTGIERGRIADYGRQASPKFPKGWGECGLLIVFHHRCPNNSIPVLHNRRKGWHPVFPRHS